MKMTGLSSGTLYLILLRFERYGLLDSEWEDGDPSKLQRPRRRLYRISKTGAQLASRALGDLSPSFPAIPITVEALSA